MPRRSATTQKQAEPRKDRVLALARQAGVLRPRDLEAEGIPREYLRRLLADGLLERPGRGIYIAAGRKPTPNHSLAEAAKRVPHGVVCLLSALQFHELTSQAPFEVWLAIGEKARRPGGPEAQSGLSAAEDRAVLRCSPFPFPPETRIRGPTSDRRHRRRFPPGHHLDEKQRRRPYADYRGTTVKCA